jgi:hypothetical protein
LTLKHHGVPHDMITHLRSYLPEFLLDCGAALAFALLDCLLAGRLPATASGTLAHATPAAIKTANATFLTVRTPSVRSGLPDTT